MLTIRDEQLVAFETERRDRFVERAVEYLREFEADADADESLYATAGAAWDMAARHELRNEYDVMRLVGLCHIFGPSFDSDPRWPWVRELLADPSMSAGKKLGILWGRMRARD